MENKSEYFKVRIVNDKTKLMFGNTEHPVWYEGMKGKVLLVTDISDSSTYYQAKKGSVLKNDVEPIRKKLRHAKPNYSN